MTVDLVHITYSPWSDRACWVLDHVGVSWRSQPYVPVIGEPRLRLRLRDPRGRVSVPILFTDNGPLRSSWEIARWATRNRPELMPEGTERIDGLAEEALRSGRVNAGRRMLADPEAIRASRPWPANRLGRLGSRITRDGWRAILKKYREPGMTPKDHAERQHARLEALEEALGDGPYIFSAFSYADITAASALSFVRPHAVLGLSEPERRRWEDPRLAERFGGLLQWRDALIREHRFARRPDPTAASR